MDHGQLRALQLIPSPLLELGDIGRCTGPQGPRNGRLLSTAGPPQGSLHARSVRMVTLFCAMVFGPTEYATQGIEQFVDGAIADHFLRHLHLVPQRGKETVSPQILA